MSQLTDKTPQFTARHPQIRGAVAVFAGGFIGSGLRAGLSLLQSAGWSWPWVTFCINLLGSLLLGFLLEYLATTGPDTGRRRDLRLFAGTGMIGGFTTYGTFILEADTRMLDDHIGMALAYLVVSVVLGVFFAGIGVLAARSRVTALKSHDGHVGHDEHDEHDGHEGHDGQSRQDDQVGQNRQAAQGGEQ